MSRVDALNSIKIPAEFSRFAERDATTRNWNPSQSLCAQIAVTNELAPIYEPCDGDDVMARD